MTLKANGQPVDPLGFGATMFRWDKSDKSNDAPSEEGAEAAGLRR